MLSKQPRVVRISQDGRSSFLPTVSPLGSRLGLVTGDIGSETLVGVDRERLEVDMKVSVHGSWINTAASGGVIAGAWLFHGLYRDDCAASLVDHDGGVLWERPFSSHLLPWGQTKLVDWSRPGLVTILMAHTLEELERRDLSDLRAICGDLFLAFVGDGDDLTLGFDANVGEIRWRRSMAWKSAEGVLAPADWNQLLFFARNEKTLAMFSKDDGRELWRKRLFTGGRVRSTGEQVIVLVRRLDDSLLGLSTDKYLMSFDSKTGDTLYERQLQTPEEDFSPAWASYPVVGKEHVVFAERSGLLGAFRMSDGELAWSYKYKAQLYEPCIVGNSIAVASADGNLLMFDNILPVL